MSYNIPSHELFGGENLENYSLDALTRRGGV